MIQFVLGIEVCLAFTYFYLHRHRQNGTKGPINVPFLGNFLQIGFGIDDTGLGPLLFKWSQLYGPIFPVHFAAYPAVVINDGNLIRQAFAMPQLSGRPELNVTTVRTDGEPRGIIFNEGRGWMEQRRFMVRQLKDFGFGKNTMDTLILDEAQHLLAIFHKNARKPIPTDSIFNVAIINALWAIVAGQRFDIDDLKLQKLVSCVNQNLAETGGSGAMILLPRLSKMFPGLSGWNAYLEAFETKRAFISDFVNLLLQNHQSGNCCDFIDTYIDEISNTTDTKSSFYKEEGVKNLTTTLDDIFNAGSETTSTTLTWLLLCLAVNPDVQEKFQAEIDLVIGRGRPPGLADRPGMMYTEALISEVLRISSVVHVGVFHSALEDTVFNDTVIPKGTMVCPNLHGVHHDPQVWPDPHKFSPERFLAPDGRTAVSHDAFLPFSAGKRICPGETLARHQLFLMATSIFQEFVVTPDPSAVAPSLVGVCKGVVTKPQKHKLVFQYRDI